MTQWSTNCGVIEHSKVTQQRMHSLLPKLEELGYGSVAKNKSLLGAADIVCNMAMWLSVHMTYAKNVHLSGEALGANDFKETPQGHTGGVLNMVPAYVGYMLANALTGKTRAWIMEQGHCVAAIDAVNVLLRNIESEQNAAYPLSDEGLSKLCQDFYSYQYDHQGRSTAPLGSHVNPYTAGGIIEGGYLGFAGLQYPHMPLPEQQLVAFLSDGAFEEQRGPDWASRWWRGEDTGLIMPIMIANGRRIEQRTTLAQKGGVGWLAEHLSLNGFEPIEIDGRDPAAFAWAIITMEERLTSEYQGIVSGNSNYPIRMPYAIAESVKGFGFPGAGTNAAHNLPIEHSPAESDDCRKLFNFGASKLFVPRDELTKAIRLLSCHSEQSRNKEKNHCLRTFETVSVDVPDYTPTAVFTEVSPMSQIDEWFVEFAKLNTSKRFRIANPDELRSNRFNRTLDHFKHRVTAPEQGVAESIMGSVITALNEEAVISAALANKQGVNLAVSYEAFAVKMLGAMRQEVIFSRNMLKAGKPVNWLSVPVIVTSHTWENGKNEMSHQDPTLSAAWLQEMSDIAPVYFPFDGNSGVEVIKSIYKNTGQVATVVAPKGIVRTLSNKSEAQRAVRNGALVICDEPTATIQIIAIGAYQLSAALAAAQELKAKGVISSVVAMLEPGRFRTPRDSMEADYVHDAGTIGKIIPPCEKRVVVSHTHGDVITGVLRNLDTGPKNTVFMGYENKGGTLDVAGMQLSNRQDSQHIVTQCLKVLGIEQ